MTKPRALDTVEDLLRQALVLLGQPRIIAITGRKASQVKAWSDPDDGRRSLPLICALLIDRELKADGHEPLFAGWMVEQLHGLAVAGSDEGPLDLAMTCVTSSARALEETQAALKDKTIQAHEREALLLRVASLQKGLGRFRRALMTSSRVHARS